MQFPLCLFFCVAFPLFAAEELDEPVPSYSWWDCHPVHVGGEAIRLGEADVTIDNSAAGHLFFRREGVFLSTLLPLSREHIFCPRVDWNAVNLYWSQNPAFNQRNFYYFRFSLSYYMTALEKWRWVFRGDYTLDQEHFNEPGPYGLSSGLIWGRYDLFKEWHYHVGALAYVGLGTTTFYPLIGFDYQPTEHWFIQAVFPILYSLEYHFNPSWSLSIKARPIKERIRVDKDEPRPQSVFNYSTVGGELNLRYEKFLRCDFQVFAGYNFGGPFYIKSRIDPRALYTQVGGSPYAGVSLDYGF